MEPIDKCDRCDRLRGACECPEGFSPTVVMKTLYVCLQCKHHWHGDKPHCPKCNSMSVIEDQLHVLPSAHGLYACVCDNPYFKIGKRPHVKKRQEHGIYFKCIRCGKNSSTEDIGL